MEVLSRWERVKFVCFFWGGGLFCLPTLFHGQWQHLDLALLDIGFCFIEKRSDFMLQIALVAGNSVLGG